MASENIDDILRQIRAASTALDKADHDGTVSDAMWCNMSLAVTQSDIAAFKAEMRICFSEQTKGFPKSPQ